jgi:hypothetical protein
MQLACALPAIFTATAQNFYHDAAKFSSRWKNFSIVMKKNFHHDKKSRCQCSNSLLHLDILERGRQIYSSSSTAIAISLMPVFL